MKNDLNDKACSPSSSHFVSKKGKWLKGQLHKLTTTNNNSPLPNLGGEKCFILSVPADAPQMFCLIFESNIMTNK